MSGVALIGWSGLIGGTLLRQRAFDARFRSSDIGEIAGRVFDMVYCAGAPAEKWRANREPDADLAAIARLTGAMEQCRAGRVVLVSTIDVYPVPDGVDESTAIDDGRAEPYGRHRHALERFMVDRWPTTVVRLPAVFGSGLKKNAVYDLLHDHRVEHLDPRAIYQFYDLQSLSADIDDAVAAGINLINLVPEPLPIGEVAENVFGRRLAIRPDVQSAPRYDARTLHGARFGRSDGYILGRDGVLARLRAFVAAERSTR